MLYNAQHRAKRDGVPCTITIDDIDIPTHCPVLGRMLHIFEGKQGGRDDSPSLDKVIPALGYVPGNILVVSQKANRLKNQLSTEQLIAFARLYVEAEQRMKEAVREYKPQRLRPTGTQLSTPKAGPAVADEGTQWAGVNDLPCEGPRRPEQLVLPLDDTVWS